MEFLNQTFVALRGPTGAPQTAADTIGKLSDRLSPATLLADRRAAVLSLKGLSRDCKRDVGDRALPGLLNVLANDVEIDADIGKAVLETLCILCDTEDDKELGYRHTDYVLANERTTHTLVALLGDTTFYTRFMSLQFLAVLLHNRRQVVQGYFLKASGAPTNVVAVLEDKREIIRNEALAVLQTLIANSPDIQKILAFEGVFEKLFAIVSNEGGIEGGVVAQQVLTCVDMLLQFNTYFRETPLPHVLCSLLQYPSILAIEEPAPQEFALQFWDEMKYMNASLIIAIMGLLVASKGGNLQETFSYTRCLVELALASNAPTVLKTQALRLLPTNLNFPLSQVMLTPYIPVPETNGEEWDRLEPTTALDALVELAIAGEYNGLNSAHRHRDSLELRSAAVSVFENFVRREEVKTAILEAMLPPEEITFKFIVNSGSEAHPPITPLLQALTLPPDVAPTNMNSIQMAMLLFSHLVRSSSRAKAIARKITPTAAPPPGLSSGSQFFVPADGGPPPGPPEETHEDTDEPPQALIPLLSEHLSLALLSRARADTSDRESREWDHLVVAYLSLLAQWLWEDPAAVRDFLDAGGMGVLVEPINQTSELDSTVPGLCAFLLGICYEFNRDPGEITRSTTYPIIGRLGVDNLVGRMTRLREDERFKAITPESIVLPYPTPAHFQPGLKAQQEGESEIWLDWAFVDFWKSNYYAVQRGFSAEPNQLSVSSGPNAEAEALTASLREVIRNQASEIEKLKSELVKQQNGSQELEDVRQQLVSLRLELQSSEEKRIEAEAKRKDNEKEQEDLLVLLDELSTKRKADKLRLREAGLDVSEDEADDDEDGEDEEP
ncbi:hypothetical protein FISHEDRAFT_47744 [Fistulina hepatica ATCC 64428]|uniref:Vesicle tethering protein Uso1/P115-like head domain-containing protein n=1 Tax=Fistulina hepatica ATCC 64428 TaxID=1128425 RepID=A0A0D7A5X3_9AGAR|nr:hypothetical protein FISHEDRAFT_47744 [Fistulina hepatica ATCC 64428]